ncbi:MAG: hypothetical protein WDO19_17910 [Bacteroidota bacterium]
MKRRTLWIIGVTAAIVTVIGLNAALGSRYRMHHGYYNHSCMHNKSDGVNKTTPSAESTGDSSRGR